MYWYGRMYLLGWAVRCHLVLAGRGCWVEWEAEKKGGIRPLRPGKWRWWAAVLWCPDRGLWKGCLLDSRSADGAKALWRSCEPYLGRLFTPGQLEGCCYLLHMVPQLGHCTHSMPPPCPTPLPPASAPGDDVATPTTPAAAPAACLAVHTASPAALPCCLLPVPQVDDVAIPTGDVASVRHTPFDFTSPHTVGDRIDDVPGAACWKLVSVGGDRCLAVRCQRASAACSRTPAVVRNRLLASWKHRLLDSPLHPATCGAGPAPGGYDHNVVRPCCRWLAEPVSQAPAGCQHLGAACWLGTAGWDQP